MRSRFLRAFDSTPSTMEAPIALVLVAFIALLIFQAYALHLGQPFDPYSFGSAAGLVMGGGGIASYGQGYMMRSRSMLNSSISSAQHSGSGVVDNPDEGA